MLFLFLLLLYSLMLLLLYLSAISSVIIVVVFVSDVPIGVAALVVEVVIDVLVVVLVKSCSWSWSKLAFKRNWNISRVTKKIFETFLCLTFFRSSSSFWKKRFWRNFFFFLSSKKFFFIFTHFSHFRVLVKQILAFMFLFRMLQILLFKKRCNSKLDRYQMLYRPDIKYFLRQVSARIGWYVSALLYFKLSNLCFEISCKNPITHIATSFISHVIQMG